MKDIPLHRVALIKPFAEFLGDVGASYERGFRKNKIPITALDDINLYIPSHRFWSFCEYMAKKEGIDSLGFLVGKRFGANSIDPNFHKVLACSPSLFRGLLTYINLAKKTVSKNKVWLYQPPNSEVIRVYNKASLERSHPAFHQIDWFGLMAIVGIVQVFAGPNWRPTEIGTSSREKPSRAIQDHLSNTRIITTHHYSYITVENSQLHKPPFAQHDKAAQMSKDLSVLNYENIPNDFVTSFKSILKSYYMDFYPTLDLSAEICAIQKRTLQRYLKNQGSSFNKAMSEVSFDIGKDLLLNPDLDINDVARELHYSNSAHFARAFRRVYGVSPTEYRRDQIIARSG